MKSNQTDKSGSSDIEKKLELREAEIAVVNSIQQSILANKEMQEIYDLVGEKIRELFDAQVVGLCTFNLENQTEQFHYLFEDNQLHNIPPRPIDNLRNRLIDTGEVILINENVYDAWKEITGEDPKVAEGTKPTKSALYVPMAAGNTVFGYLTLQNLDREHAFSNSDVSLLSTMANSISMALVNARLFNETEQRNAELAVINSVQQAIAAELDIQGIYDLVGDQIRDIFDAQVVMIATFDHANRQEIFKYHMEAGKRHYAEPRPYDKIRQRLINSKKLINIPEKAAEAYTTITGEAAKSVPGTVFPQSMVYVPLLVGDEVKGYVSLQNLDREHAFGEFDIRLLGTLANSMSVALENARLFNETEQRNVELAVINSVQEGLVAEMDMQGIYDLVGEKIRTVFDAQVTALCMFDLESKTEIWKYVFEDGDRVYPPPRPYDKVREKLIIEKKTLFLNENAAKAMSEINGQQLNAIPGTGLPQSVIFVPLMVGDSVRGYVTLQNIDKNHAFKESDVRLLNTLVNSMSVALENARLFSESEQRNAELAVINSIQKGLVAEMDMQGIYDLVGDRIREVFDAQVTAIAIFDQTETLEDFKYLFEDGQRYYPNARPYDKVREKLIADPKMLVINENAAQAFSEITGKPQTAVPGTRQALSAVFVPMIVGETVRGYVSLQNLDREHAFSESDVRLLATLTNSMSVALENARLFNETTRLLAETERRNAELAVINSIQEGLVREMDMQAIYRLVGNRISEVLNIQALVIRTFDHENQLEIWEYAMENGKLFDVDPRPYIWANKHLIKSKEALLINEEYVETAKKYGDKDKGVSTGLPPKSAIFVPMIVGDKVMGSISLQNVEKEHAFSDSDLRLLNTITNSMSVALENARLFNETTRLLGETEQRAVEMQTVNNISRALVSHLEFDSLINLIGEQMKETFKADIVYLAMHDRPSDMLHFPYYFGDKSESRPFGNGITEKIILKKEPILINEDLSDAYEKMKMEKKGKWVHSFLGVPIVIGDHAIGVISVQSMKPETQFSEYDQRLLTTIASNVGVAMQNAEAYQKLQEALADLQALQDQLIQQEKLASLGQLTAGIAHEIKNPLNFVNNFSGVSIEILDEVITELKNPDSKNVTPATITRALEDLQDIRKNLTKIVDHGTRADSIVKSMLQHSRGSNGKMEPTLVNPLIKEYVNLAFHGMRAGKKPINVDIDLQLDEKIGELPLIAEDFSRVILNLCNNAFDAMRDESEKVDDSSKKYTPKLTVRTKSDSKTITLEIEDNGPGIPEKLKDKILQPFFTTKKGTEGTGLGLSITNDIIKAHGGSLDIKTEEGNGSLFIISLPNA